jgi:hypothetical protein
VNEEELLSINLAKVIPKVTEHLSACQVHFEYRDQSKVALPGHLLKIFGPLARDCSQFIRVELCTGFGCC